MAGRLIPLHVLGRLAKTRGLLRSDKRLTRRDREYVALTLEDVESMFLIVDRMAYPALLETGRLTP